MQRCYKIQAGHSYSFAKTICAILTPPYMLYIRNLELLPMNRTPSQRLVQTRTQHKGNAGATHIEADRPRRLALTTRTHASLNPRGKVASGTAGTARRRVSQYPYAHERPRHLYITRTNEKRWEREEEKDEGAELLYEYRMTKVTKPDDDAKLT